MCAGVLRGVFWCVMRCEECVLVCYERGRWVVLWRDLMSFLWWYTYMYLHVQLFCLTRPITGNSEQTSAFITAVGLPTAINNHPS